MPLLSDRTLATRLELIVAQELRGFVRNARELFADSPAEFIEVGGGVAAYLDPGSPVNGAAALGMVREATRADAREVARFYHDRGADALVAVCPLADPSLHRVLAGEGFTIGTFENVLVRELGAGEVFEPACDGIEVRVARTEAERDGWALLCARGFTAPDEPSDADLRLAATASRRGSAELLIALVDGEPAGTAQLDSEEEVAWLSADTTLPRFRRRGVQSSLQRVRLEMARDAGCTLAVTESIPGSDSQRNMERLGFRLAYTRVDAVLPLPGRQSDTQGDAQ